MKVWIVTNEFGKGDKCYFESYRNAFDTFEINTEEDDSVSDAHWYRIFRSVDINGDYKMHDKDFYDSELELNLGEWKLFKGELTEKDFLELEEFEGW